MKTFLPTYAWPSSSAVPVQPAALELLTAASPVLFLDRARALDLGGTAVPLIDLDDLIVAKILAGHPKDLDDAAALWCLHRETAHADRIWSTLTLLEEALSPSQGDLVSAFDAIARRRYGTSHPAPSWRQ